MQEQKHLTFREMEERFGVDSHSIKRNVATLIQVLPVQERVVVLEAMVESKEHRRR